MRDMASRAFRYWVRQVAASMPTVTYQIVFEDNFMKTSLRSRPNLVRAVAQRNFRMPEHGC